MPAHRLDNYLRTHRKRSGLALHELAFLLGKSSRADAFRYERGRRPSLEAALACEALFGTPAAEVFTGARDQAVGELRQRLAVLTEGLSRRAQNPARARKLQFLEQRASALANS